nr:unnamed protein product [Callosobruchus chinensis]
MKSILFAVLILNLDYCLGATSIVNPDNAIVVRLRSDPGMIQERSLWDEITLVTRMSSDLQRRDILDALIVGVKVAEIIPGLPTLLVKCLKMWERTLKMAQPLFWGIFPKTKPPGAKALKLPFKVPHIHIKISLIFKLVDHVFKVMEHPQLLVTDVRHLPNMIVKSGKCIIKSRKKIMMGVVKLPRKIMNGMIKLSTKLMNGTMKSPMKLLNIGKGVAKSPFKMLGHTLHHGQSKESKKSKKKFGLNLNYMNMLGNLLKHPHMGDESPKVRNKQLKEIAKSSET